MKEFIKNYGWLFIAFGIIVFIMVKCSDKEKEEKDEKRIQREERKRLVADSILNNEFMYIDLNNVYHLEYDCWSQSEHNALKRVDKTAISNWHDFAKENFLCVHCFDEEKVEELHNRKVESIYNAKPRKVIRTGSR